MTSQSTDAHSHSFLFLSLSLYSRHIHLNRALSVGVNGIHVLNDEATHKSQ